MEMRQPFYRLDTSRNGYGEQILHLTPTNPLNTSLKILINWVSELILILDSRNNPIIHLID